MIIAIIGTGYVGLVTGACFSEMGNTVYCVDKDIYKIEKLKRLEATFYEPGLDDLIKSNYLQGRLKFSCIVEDSIADAGICFIAVGTPPDESGDAELKQVIEAAKEIGRHMNRDTHIVIKSTVPVGTADIVSRIISEELIARGVTFAFDVISNPEFLKEGSAVNDCLRPDRIVIGTDNESAIRIMRELYLPFIRNTENFITMDVKSAEMTKYVANAMLATKISFMNEMANICERIGADINQVRIGIGSDARIGYSFIYAGCGYGGSCFPKDIKALISTSQKNDYTPSILKAVEEVNDKQKLVLPQKIFARFGENLTGYRFAVWGLSFKPGTNDMREASSIAIIEALTEAGAKISAYDPKAMDEAKEIYLKGNTAVEYTDTPYSAIKDADALLLITEWKEFRSPDFVKVNELLKQPIIFDGRNQYDKKVLEEKGFEYYQIGVSTKEVT
jgi:UDPglucose 6-dehydrogenase